MVPPNGYYLVYGLLTEPVNQNVGPHCQGGQSDPAGQEMQEYASCFSVGES